MDKYNIKPYSFRLIMPNQLDLSGQVNKAYQNMGFDAGGVVTDIGTGTRFLDLIRYMPKENVQKFLWAILKQNNETRQWLSHLFASDFEKKVAHTKIPNIYWQHLVYLPFSEANVLQENLIEVNENLSIVKIQEVTFQDLYEKTKQKIMDALELF